MTHASPTRRASDRLAPRDLDRCLREPSLNLAGQRYVDIGAVDIAAAAGDRAKRGDPTRRGPGRAVGIDIARKDSVEFVSGAACGGVGILHRQAPEREYFELVRIIGPAERADRPRINAAETDTVGVGVTRKGGG